MNRGETLIDLARQHPRIAVGAVVFAVVIAVSQNVLVAIVLAIVVASQTKEEWIDAFSTTPSGYLDRDAQSYDPADLETRPSDRIESMPRYSAMTAAALDAEDEAEEEWVAPQEPDPPAIPEMRREASGVRYGITVPPKKPVDVPRR